MNSLADFGGLGSAHDQTNRGTRACNIGVKNMLLIGDDLGAKLNRFSRKPSHTWIKIYKNASVHHCHAASGIHLRRR